MNFGLRNRHISSEAVPAISTGPDAEPISRLRASAPSVSQTTFSPTPSDPLTSTRSPSLSSSGTIVAASRASATTTISPSNSSAIAAASGPTVTSSRTPASLACCPSATW